MIRVLYNDPDDGKIRLSCFNDIYLRMDGDDLIGLECDSSEFEDTLIFDVDEDLAEELLKDGLEYGNIDMREYDCDWYHEEETSDFNF